jgi:hypothetical protein
MATTFRVRENVRCRPSSGPVTHWPPLGTATETTGWDDEDALYRTTLGLLGLKRLTTNEQLRQAHSSLLHPAEASRLRLHEGSKVCLEPAGDLPVPHQQADLKVVGEPTNGEVGAGQQRGLTTAGAIFDWSERVV